MPTPRAGPAPLGRELRLDMFRGLALVMIFINHVPGTIYEQFTSRNFGFSDAAEAFVFMSGMAAGLAYSGAFMREGLLVGTLRVWARVRQLYFVHIAITLIAAGIFAGAASAFALPSLLARNNMAAFFDAPVDVLIGLPTLLFQLGYLNILPLYVVLLFAAPLMLVIALHRPLMLVAAAVALWALAGYTGITIPSYPGPDGWFFDPFAWQLMFAAGLSCGVAMRRGKPLIGYHPRLFWAALTFVLIVALWMRVPEIGRAGRSGLAILSDAGAPAFLVWFNKATLALPRALHAFALFYVLSSIAAVATFSASSWARPLVILGQRALPVFATGTLIAIALQAVKTAITPGPLLDGVLLAAGMALQFGLAYTLDALARHKARSAPLVPDPERPLSHDKNTPGAPNTLAVPHA